MACLTSILFHNTRADDSSSGATDNLEEDPKPHAKRRWVQGRDHFLRGLIICAGRRHALGLETSGCISGRGRSDSSSRSLRLPSFEDWDTVDDISYSSSTSRAAAGIAPATTATNRRRSSNSNSNKPCIDDFGNSLRPMITFYAFMDALSEVFVVNMPDTEVEECSSKLVHVLEQCQKAKSFRELLTIAKITSLDDEEMLDEFQKGMMAA